MLRISNLHVGYGGGQSVLAGVSLELNEGDLVAVIGPNGAGKTTLLRAISGLIRPHLGTITFEGKNTVGMNTDALVRMGIVHIPEGRQIFGRMSTRENLLLGAFTRHDPDGVDADLERVLTLFPRLKERFGQLAGTMSGGEQQMLAIGRGLMSRPRLLMLDEPSLGIAPVLLDKIFEAIEEIKRQKVTILLVEQNANRALAVADYGQVIDLGRLVAGGEARKLLNDDSIRRAYLGL